MMFKNVGVQNVLLHQEVNGLKHLNIIMNEKDQKVWIPAKLECNLCSHIWIGVYHMGSKKLECPSCGNMTLFNVIKTISINLPG